MGEGEEKSGRGKILTAVVVIVIIVLWILIPNMAKIIQSDDDDGDKPIYKTYEISSGEDTVVYKNEELNVTITRVYDDYWDYTSYEAEWVDMWGESESKTANNPMNLLDEVLTEVEDMSTNQMKWYEYMCKNVVK